MRVGFNPNRNKKLVPSAFWHQVVIPLYIPHAEGYFKDAFKIFKICLGSLTATAHPKTFITIINNGSCEEVIQYLNNCFTEGIIHEIIHTENIGKINAVLKGLPGHNFPLLSICDADVFFLPGWQHATYKVFQSFPKCGAVCPTPSPRSLRTQTSNIFLNEILNKRLGFEKVPDPDALIRFAKSVGNSNFYNAYQLKWFLCVRNSGVKAVVGAGHFAVTYRREVFDKVHNLFQPYGLGGDSEALFLDLPVLNRGLWRLSTFKNLAYHMGNVWEDWMETECQEVLAQGTKQKVVPTPDFLHPLPPKPGIIYKLQNKIINRLIKNKRLLGWILIHKGLPKTAVKEYLG